MNRRAFLARGLRRIQLNIGLDGDIGKTESQSLLNPAHLAIVLWRKKQMRILNIRPVGAALTLCLRVFAGGNLPDAT